MKKTRAVALLVTMCASLAAGCESLGVTEIRGKTAFGPEFRNFGNNTSDVRYTEIHGFEAKLTNNWTAGVLYQRRDVDDGSGDNENLVLFEIGYPIWNNPKDGGKSAEEMQIEQLEKELRKLDSELAAAGRGLPDSNAEALVQSGKVE